MLKQFFSLCFGLVLSAPLVGEDESFVEKRFSQSECEEFCQTQFEGSSYFGNETHQDQFGLPQSREELESAKGHFKEDLKNWKSILAEKYPTAQTTSLLVDTPVAILFYTASLFAEGVFPNVNPLLSISGMAIGGTLGKLSLFLSTEYFGYFLPSIVIEAYSGMLKYLIRLPFLGGDWRIAMILGAVDYVSYGLDSPAFKRNIEEEDYLSLTLNFMKQEVFIPSVGLLLKSQFQKSKDWNKNIEMMRTDFLYFLLQNYLSAVLVPLVFEQVYLPYHETVEDALKSFLNDLEKSFDSYMGWEDLEKDEL